MNENELKLGKMSVSELADWFGVKLKTFQNNKQKKLEELSLFADFEPEYGGVNITKIKISIYAKKGSRAYNIIKEKFPLYWHESGYDTAARVGSAIWKDNKELQELISENTAKNYTARVRTEFYGRVHIQEEGSKGWCKYAYVVVNNWDEAVLLTEKQNEAITQLRREIYTNEQEPFIYEAYKNKELTEEQYQEALAEWQNNAEARYFEFMNGITKILGFCPTKVTQIINKVESVF